MHYKVCSIDEHGNLTRETDVICRDDILATLIAQSMLGTEDIELWEYERKVAQFDGIAEAARGD
ncbi:hypothetical protein [Rhodopseudomonas sp. P2A-2r]|uniref:hypothetical protein n=1 Tax=unclassified Rhodopseudomonas TaxID=2638247 RepID=UPI002234C9FB|nr:hypothetical protein [Rhodopseudomonas sp. P2A-2r]UZE47596.1 hypothetical protein ONR75_22190 [Rhodopseudomonas sp. P2A-2r]